MEIFLHLGAHRTASTSFQAYLRSNRDDLNSAGLGFWGPWRTRNGLLNDVVERPDTHAKAQRAAGRVQLAVAQAQRKGFQHLLVSDENMLGTPRRCLRDGVLYAGAGERVARLASAFGHVRGITLQIRAQDMWWSSLISYLISRGQRLPEKDKIAAIAAGTRTWRDVIIDIACACPEAAITVTPFERFTDRPDKQLGMITGLAALPTVKPGEFWRNRRPDLSELRATLSDRGEDPDRLPEGEGRYMPFDARQRSALREAYADDLFWLQSGAEGLATLQSDADPARCGAFPAAGSKLRGQRHDRPARRLARDR